ncbi:hypothetical protein [Mesorhizobium huakuii]|uniref:Uncharacterized protein n=1 Tax=Mesorhizobium huakuii TaxID=28104 RepID=A0ABZ0VS16_9HYPH|nr:hypothetical protein [Mesorhizobium huakuii]WQB99747.1 hypothetical protein U0R22_003940 [Mesorhizobium huakuii]
MTSLDAILAGYGFCSRFWLGEPEMSAYGDIAEITDLDVIALVRDL